MSFVRITIPAKSRGFHLITDLVQNALDQSLSEGFDGVCHLFLRHTSASLTINENSSPDVREDMENVLNRIVPEGHSYLHSEEGPDDMPAHVKSSLLGCSLTIPIVNSKLFMGTWQGIYLGEHRDAAGARNMILTCIKCS